jgi:hypothetical protein
MTQIKTVCVDKVAYEAVLRNSIRVNDLEAENQRLKELLLSSRGFVDKERITLETSGFGHNEFVELKNF